MHASLSDLLDNDAMRILPSFGQQMILYILFRFQKEASEKRWWKFKSYESNSAFVQVRTYFPVTHPSRRTYLCTIGLIVLPALGNLHAHSVILRNVGVPYRLALGVPAIR